MKLGLCGQADCPRPYEFCEACVRADERKQEALRGPSVAWYEAHDRAVRTDLRAKIEALPRPRMSNDAFVMDERWDLWRAKVLALFDGSS